VVLLLALAYAGLTLARNESDPLVFARIGTRYSEGDPEGTQGYDGQFAYFIARDPLEGCLSCDEPAYRAQRILYPLLAWVLALGNVEAVGWTLAAINVVALAAGTFFTEQLLASQRASRWYALLYGLYGGLVAGLRLDLTEPLALALVQAGLWAWERERRGTTAGLLALAALAKETMLLAAAGLVLHLALVRSRREATGVGLAAILPFAAWQGVLWAWLGAPGVGSGGAMATPFEWLPFGGLLRVATVSRPVFWLLLAIEGPLFVLPSVWALVVSLRDLVRRRWHPWVTVLLARAAAMPFLPFSTWREPLAMARLAAGLVAATLLYGALRRDRRVLRYSLVWLATLALLGG
jgi:hypothetical protein